MGWRGKGARVANSLEKETCNDFRTSALFLIDREQPQPSPGPVQDITDLATHLISIQPRCLPHWHQNAIK